MLDATERKTLAVSAFIASLLLFPLGGKLTSVMQLFRERVSALMALGLAILLLVFHILATRREERAAPPPTPPPTTPN